MTTAEEITKHKLAQDLSRQITRRWRAGDVYAPHDLSSVEMAKWKNRGRPVHDVFDVLDFKPEEHYRVCLSSHEDGLGTVWDNVKLIVALPFRISQSCLNT